MHAVDSTIKQCKDTAEYKCSHSRFMEIVAYWKLDFSLLLPFLTQWSNHASRSHSLNFCLNSGISVDGDHHFSFIIVNLASKIRKIETSAGSYLQNNQRQNTHLIIKCVRSYLKTEKFVLFTIIDTLCIMFMNIFRAMTTVFKYTLNNFFCYEFAFNIILGSIAN